MNELKAGSELDSAVAVAIGLQLKVRSHNVADAIYAREWFRITGRDVPEDCEVGGKLSDWLVHFNPSEDINTAIAVAEIVGLFDGNWLGKLMTGWAVMELETREVIGPSDGCRTPALAISAAILKTKAG